MQSMTPILQERSIDNETQSYLRATESVMSAMQARMTSQPQENADSEEESALTAGAVTAKSLTAQLRAKLKALEEKSVRSKHHAAIAATKTERITHHITHLTLHIVELVIDRNF